MQTMTPRTDFVMYPPPGLLGWMRDAAAGDKAAQAKVDEWKRFAESVIAELTTGRKHNEQRT